MAGGQEGARGGGSLKHSTRQALLPPSLAPALGLPLTPRWAGLCPRAPCRHGVVRVEEQEEDLYAAVDLVSDKLKRKMVKVRGEDG